MRGKRVVALLPRIHHHRSSLGRSPCSSPAEQVRPPSFWEGFERQLESQCVDNVHCRRGGVDCNEKRWRSRNPRSKRRHF